MRLILFVLLSIAPFVSKSLQAEERAAFTKLTNETRQLIKDRMALYQIPGVAVAIFDQDETLWLECFGVRDSSSGLPVTPKTIFSIQSASKTVTATAIMLAVQNGRLDLDKPITEYLPEFTINSPFEVFPERKITLRKLLTHTAGLTGESKVGNNSIAGFSPFSEYTKSIGETWLVSPVGTKHLYGNISIDLAGEVLQRVPKKPFSQVIRDDLFQPLGMSRSFVDTLKVNGNADNVARGHSPSYSKLPSYIPMSASGGIRMSIEDAVRFVQFHLNKGRVDGKTILRRELLDQMYRRSVRAYASGESVWSGLGIQSWAEAETYTMAHHGAGFGFRYGMRWYPEYGIGVVMMANSFELDHINWEATRNVLLNMVNRGIVNKVKGNSAIPAQRFLSNTPGVFTSDRSPTPPLKPQSFRPEWKQYLGRYRKVYGGGFERSHKADNEPDGFVEKKYGYLVFRMGTAEERLFEQEPGLFFLENLGEALDLRENPPTIGNNALKKID